VRRFLSGGSRRRKTGVEKGLSDLGSMGGRFGARGENEFFASSKRRRSNLEKGGGVGEEEGKDKVMRGSFGYCFKKRGREDDVV